MFVLSASLGFSAGNVAKEISLNRKRPCPEGVQGSGARSCSVQAACIPAVILAVPPRGHEQHLPSSGCFANAPGPGRILQQLRGLCPAPGGG